MTASSAVSLASVSSTPTAAGAGQTPGSLTTRFLDFWLLGGASLLVWAIMVALTSFRGTPAIGQQFQNLTTTSASLALLVNYPHFAISYKLAYTRGRPFIVRCWLQLIAVPIALAALFASAYAFYQVPVGQLPLVWKATQFVSSWGVNAQVLSGPRLGDLLLTGAFTLMVFTIGWHYTKQVFGCVMVYAHFDGYHLTHAQRQLTKWALLSIWIMSIIDNNISGTWRVFGGFSYSSLDLPDIARPLSVTVVVAGFGLVLVKVFYENYRATGQRPSLNMLVPFVAMYVWWLPFTRQDEFYFLLIPLFHSLQYLAFAYRVEDRRLRGAPYRDAWATLTIVGVVVAGWLAFELVPESLDSRLGTSGAWGLPFFVIAAMLFVNIHHYFIDSVVWRFKDPQVRSYLLN